MNKSLIDILACPADKHHPLEIYGDQSGNDTIEEGALYCDKCNRFYLIIKGIPVMLPDELRDKDEEISLLNTMSGLPDKIIQDGRPWNLSSS